MLRQFAVGMRRPGSLLGVTLVSIGVNAPLNGAFIYGWLGLPELGLPPPDWPPRCVQFFTLAVFYSRVRRDTHSPDSGLAHPALPHLRSRAVARRMVAMGTPSAFTYGSEAAITSIASLMMGGFGPAMLAA